VRNSAIVALGFLPLALWSLASLTIYHLPISYEADQYGQFVWLFHHPDIAGHLANWFPQVLWWLGWPALIAVAGIAVLSVHTPAKPDRLLIGIAMAAAAVLVFNLLQGYYQARLVNGVTLCLFAAVARQGAITGRRRIADAVLIAGAALQTILAFAYPSLTLQ
jgi:hypothetical protein